MGYNKILYKVYDYRGRDIKGSIICDSTKDNQFDMIDYLEVIDLEQGEVTKVSKNEMENHFDYFINMIGVHKSHHYSPAVCLDIWGTVRNELYLENMEVVLFQISNYRQEVTSLEAENSSLTEDVSLLSSDNAYLEEKVSNLEKSINLATNDYMTVFSENNDLRILLSTYYSGIGFIVEGSSYYHSIDCLNVTSASEYWAHNVEYCEYIGYQKCPYCFSNPDYS